MSDTFDAMSEQDTDTLLAMIASLISGPVPDTNIVLNALLDANGDVQAAAEILNKRPTSSGTKRKREDTNLDSWLKDPLKGKTKPLVVTKQASPSKRTGTKGTVNLMDILRQPVSTKKTTVSRPAPLMLYEPSMVAQYTPCTLHTSVLPPELACNLFHAMLKDAKSWKRNKWWLFDRVVESPHRTSFWSRGGDAMDEASREWYAGRRTEKSKPFLPLMEEACKIIERLVNKEMQKRQRFSLEWAGHEDNDTIWSANVAASNCYEGGKESVGFHADQLTSLGPYCTIASLSLGTRRVFSLREVIPKDEKETRQAQTFNIPLPHNSLAIMHASCQERFKHSVPPQSSIDIYRPLSGEPSNCRINITFRFYRPDFPASSIPKCRCGVPTILRGDMKNRVDRYFWTCYAGAQNDGKGCNFWKVLDMAAEGRGPTVGDREKSHKITE